MRRMFFTVACLLGFMTSLHAQPAPINSCCSPGSPLTGSELLPMSQGGSAFATTTTPNAIKTFVGSSAGVTAIDSFTGGFTLGAGLSVNQPWYELFGQVGWPAYNSNNNVITQMTGITNALRNGSMTSWQHHKFMTKDNPGANPYKIGIASFTGSIANTPCTGAPAGTDCLTASSVTGVIQLFQRVDDLLNVQLTTTAGTSPPGLSTTNDCTNSPASCVLTFASTTGVVAGMYVTDLTNPRAIVGNITIVSTTGTTVTLNHPVGFVNNLPIPQSPGLPGVSSSDVIAFTTVLRGTEIVGTGTAGQGCSGCTGTGGAGTYAVQARSGAAHQMVSSETMRAAGGWGPEGVYIIPVGTAGTANYITCQGGAGLGNFTIGSAQCTAAGTLTDVIVRFPMDSVDASRVNCMLWTGPKLNCGFASLYLQPITFQFMVTWSTDRSVAPSFDTKISCPLAAPNVAGANICQDDWTAATYDVACSPCLGTTGIPMVACNLSNTPAQCNYAYTWMPTGIFGNMEVNYHTGAMTISNNDYFIIDGFELKQTPGAACIDTVPPAGNPILFETTNAHATIGATYTNNGNTFTVASTVSGSVELSALTSGGAPTASGTLTKASGTGDVTITFSAFNQYPCFQLYPGPLEIPEVADDIQRNARFAQMIGTGASAGINAGNQGAFETTYAFANSTSHFYSTWPLPVTMRCNVWDVNSKAAPRCPAPNIYITTPTDYLFRTAGSVSTAATSVAPLWFGLNGVTLDATVAGTPLTSGQPGYVLWGAGTTDMILVDSAAFGD